jgi:hypothetical protein
MCLVLRLVQLVLDLLESHVQVRYADLVEAEGYRTAYVGDLVAIDRREEFPDRFPYEFDVHGMPFVVPGTVPRRTIITHPS